MRKKNMGMKKGIVAILIGTILVIGTYVPSGCAKQKVKISKEKLSLKVGEKKKLKVLHAKNVKWKSKNPSVAAVSKKGVVTAKKKGITKIIATVKKKKYTCKVTVKLKKKTVKASAAPEVATVAPPSFSQVPPSATPSGGAAGQQETMMPSVNPTGLLTSSPAVEPTATPVPEMPDSQVVWEEGEKSGTEEDYNMYFNVEMKEYEKQQVGTELGTIESVNYHSDVIGGEREAYVYLPAGYSEEKEYPVLYMIHGLGCTREQWYSMSLNNILSNMIAKEEVVPFIAVLPSVVPKDGLTKNSYSAENIQAFFDFKKEFLQDLEPYIFSHYSVSEKPEDTGVCGLSMGGMEALDIGFSLKNHFNYIGSFSAAPSLDQSILNVYGWDFAPKVVMLCTGTNDGTVRDNPYNYHMSLLQNQVEHIWYQYPKGSHSDPVWKNGLVNFLKKSF